MLWEAQMLPGVAKFLKYPVGVCVVTQWHCPLSLHHFKIEKMNCVVCFVTYCTSFHAPTYLTPDFYLLLHAADCPLNPNWDICRETPYFFVRILLKSGACDVPIFAQLFCTGKSSQAEKCVSLLWNTLYLITLWLNSSRVMYSSITEPSRV